MTKNLSPLVWLEENYPEKAEEYKLKRLDNKRASARKHMRELYRKAKDNKTVDNLTA